MKPNNLFDDNSVYEVEDDFILDIEELYADEWQEPYTISGDIADAYNNTVF